MDDDAAGRIIFMLLEKKDEPNPRSKKAFIEIGPKNNVYEAWGSYLNDPVYNISRETNAIKLGLGQHVSYIHSKFLLRDPLGDDPIVVTGSANFSESSVQDNDENMLLIRGNARVADIYFTEFNRLFNHYYFRSVYEELRRDGGSNPEMNVFLLTDDSWLGKYKPGSLRRKRVDIFTGMARIQAVTEVLDGVTVGSGAPSQPDDC
jgi:phosphatidylserine/phosphatidylglycerophosphate/cardiolipin synthase-like enzyme